MYLLNSFTSNEVIKYSMYIIKGCDISIHDKALRILRERIFPGGEVEVETIQVSRKRDKR